MSTQHEQLLKLFSDHGNVLTLERIRQVLLAGKGSDERHPDCWIWTRGKVTGGYGEVRFFPNCRPMYVHRVSALAFLDFDSDFINLVLHRCDVKSCFNPAHLYIGTRKQNAKDAVERGQHLTGERCPWSKIKKSDIEKIIQMRKAGQFQRVIGQAFGISQAQVYRILRGQNWRSA